MPKLLWLKRHLPSTYRSAGHFFDLADYLSFRATGSTARSICTVICKWNYLAHDRRLEPQLFRARWSWRPRHRQIREDRNRDRRARHAAGCRPDEVRGTDFGLLEGTPVAASLIDAHAGGVGTIGGRGKSGERGRCAPSSCLHHGNLGLHHGDDAEALLRAGRLGSLLFGNGARVLAQRGRTVCRRCGHRSSHQVPSRL